jgi:hypothetical protein
VLAVDFHFGCSGKRELIIRVARVSFADGLTGDADPIFVVLRQANRCSQCLHFMSCWRWGSSSG